MKPHEHCRFLVDDITIGSDSSSDLRALDAQLRPHLARRGFEENPQNLVSSLPEYCRVNAMSHPCFGLIWRPHDDVLLLPPVKSSADTLKSITDLRRCGGTLFDPLGLFLEFNVQLRLLIRCSRQNADCTGALLPSDLQALEKGAER